VSFFDPLIINEKTGRTYAQERYEQILEEQVVISYSSKGISIADTDELSPFDRKLILKSILKIKEAEAEKANEARI
jgi:hypothetical protein